MPRSADPNAPARILAVAARLFYENGIRATGTAELAAAVGCGKNMLYRSYAGKDDLVAAYLRLASDRRRGQEEHAIATVGPDAGEQLVALTADIANRTSERSFRGCAMRNYLAEYPGESGAAGRIARAYLRTARRRVDLLAEALSVSDGPQLADRVWLVHEGMYAGRGRGGGAAGVDLVSDLVRQAVA